jgi:hypothetical protein
MLFSLHATFFIYPLRYTITELYYYIPLFSFISLLITLPAKRFPQLTRAALTTVALSCLSIPLKVTYESYSEIRLSYRADTSALPPNVAGEPYEITIERYLTLLQKGPVHMGDGVDLDYFEYPLMFKILCSRRGLHCHKLIVNGK